MAFLPCQFDATIVRAPVSTCLPSQASCSTLLQTTWQQRPYAGAVNLLPAALRVRFLSVNYFRSSNIDYLR